MRLSGCTSEDFLQLLIVRSTRDVFGVDLSQLIPVLNVMPRREYLDVNHGLYAVHYLVVMDLTIYHLVVDVVDMRSDDVVGNGRSYRLIDGGILAVILSAPNYFIQ